MHFRPNSRLQLQALALLFVGCQDGGYGDQIFEGISYPKFLGSPTTRNTHRKRTRISTPHDVNDEDLL